MNKTTGKILLLILIILQIITIWYWAGEKSNYDIDELYSFGYAQFFKNPRKQFKRLTHTDEWSSGNWMENRGLRDQLYQSEEESLLTLDPPSVVKKLLLEKHSFFGLLNISQSIFPDRSADLLPGLLPGLILNLIFFFLTQMILFRITEELTGNEIPALLAVTMYGFSLLAVGMAVYIRFYTFVIFMFLAVLRLHQIMRRTDSLPRFVLLTLLSMAILLIGLRNSELIFVLGTGLVFFFSVDLLIRKQYGKMCCYLLTIIPAGIYYAVQKTNFLDVIFHPEDFLGSWSAEYVVADGLTKINSKRILPLAEKYLKWFCYQLFGSRYVCAVFCIIMAALAVLWLCQKRKAPAEKDGRFGGFSLIIFFLILTYLSAALMANLTLIRYISFVFPLAAVLLWSWADIFTRGRRYRKIILTLCAILTCSGIASGQLRHSQNIQYIYRNDRTLSRAIEETGIKAAAVTYKQLTVWDRTEHSVYDCISLLPDDAMLYPVNIAEGMIDASKCPDELLIWTRRSADKVIGKYTQDLTENGYEIHKLGRNHTSDVYTARRKETEDHNTEN